MGQNVMMLFPNEKSSGQDGYAGLFGREIGKVQISIE